MKSVWGETHSPIPNHEITQDINQRFPVRVPVSKTYTRVHRIILRSADKTSGTTDDASFAVTLPNVKSPKCKVVVESFYMVNGSYAAELNNGFYHIHWRGLSQPLSYSSRMKSTSDMIATVKGCVYVPHGSSHESLGIPLGDTSALNGVVNIYFTSPAITSFSTKMSDWVLVMSVVEDQETSD